MRKSKYIRILLAVAALAINAGLMLCFAVVNESGTVDAGHVVGICLLAVLAVASAGGYCCAAYRKRSVKHSRIPFSFTFMFQYLPLWGVSFCIQRHFRGAEIVWNNRDTVYAVMLGTAAVMLVVCVTYLVLTMRGALMRQGED